MKPIIALFTDFGTRDAYVAQMKGAILSIDAGLTVLDLNHEVAAFDVRQAAYLLEESSRYLPAGSIVVTVVDPGVGTPRRPVLCGTRSDRWFVGPDNGVLTHVLWLQGLREAYELTETDYFLPHVFVNLPWPGHFWSRGGTSCPWSSACQIRTSGGDTEHPADQLSTNGWGCRDWVKFFT